MIIADFYASINEAKQIIMLLNAIDKEVHSWVDKLGQRITEIHKDDTPDQEV